MRVATVFSGIGAAEHALEVIGVDYEMVFACDNGDISPFDLKVKRDLNSIIETKLMLDEELNKAKNVVSECSVEELENKITELKEKTFKMSKRLKLNQNILELVRRMEKAELPMTLKEKMSQNKQQSLITLDMLDDYLKVVKKENLTFNTFKETVLAKEIAVLTRKTIENLNEVNEKLQTERVAKNVMAMSDYKERKKYIDSLYAKTKRKNFVYESYKANYDIAAEDFHFDVRFLDGEQYKGKVDLFVGGSPCQSFSIIGERKGLEDTRGTLFYDYARLVNQIQPKVFIYENVKGLLSHDKGRTWETMKKAFEDIGYDWHIQVLNAKDYTVPQKRQRIFVVGFRKDLKLEKAYSFPEKRPLHLTMQDILTENIDGKYYVKPVSKECSQLNWDGNFELQKNTKDKEDIEKRLAKYYLSKKVEKVVMSTGTKGFYSEPKIDLEVARALLASMHKMHRAGIDNYVTTHNKIRKLTPREALRLMGYCDSFKIVVSDTQIYKQAGNSIVVPVIVHLLQSIYESYPSLFEK